MLILAIISQKYKMHKYFHYKRDFPSKKSTIKLYRLRTQHQSLDKSKVSIHKHH